MRCGTLLLLEVSRWQRVKGEHRLAFRLLHRRVATGERSSPSLHPGGEVVRWAEARLLTASSF